MRPMPREPPVARAVRPSPPGLRHDTPRRPGASADRSRGNDGRPASLAPVAMTFDESFCACEEEALRFLVDEHGFVRAHRAIERRGDADGVHAVVVYRASAIDAESGREV